jgi:CheY-like chemotaxis protein
MEVAVLLAKRSVLVVDPLEETQEVLRAALERRGIRILAASRRQQGLELAREHHPDLIVLDLECDSAGSAAAGVAIESLAGDTPLVMLGSARGQRPLPAGQIVAKPYHYAPLIRKIEELLDAARRPATTEGRATR